MRLKNHRGAHQKSQERYDWRWDADFHLDTPLVALQNRRAYPACNVGGETADESRQKETMEENREEKKAVKKNGANLIRLNRPILSIFRKSLPEEKAFRFYYNLLKERLIWQREHLRS